jgi:hypothetical protein
MKKLNLIAATLLVFSSLGSMASVRTVCNNAISAGTFSTFASAQTASSNGDTIYLQGSTNDYGTININKRITLIGAGYNDSAQYNLYSYVDAIGFDSVQSTSGASGCSIIGIYIANALNQNYDNFFGYYSPSNVYISRCRINTMNVYNNGWVIENCVVNSSFTIEFNNVSSCIVRGNFIVSGISGNGTCTGLIIDHNIIEGAFNNINYAVVSNNIFFYAHISSSSNTSFNSFSNNITIYGSADVLPYGNNSGGNNINNASNTIFVNAPTSTQNYPNLLNYNWRLNGGTGHNAGTDGTDIGLYGGNYPMNFTGASTLPQVYYMNINNASVPLNGTLNVEFKAQKQN